MNNLEMKVECGIMYHAWGAGWDNSKIVLVTNIDSNKICTVTDGENIWMLSANRLFNLDDVPQPPVWSYRLNNSIMSGFECDTKEILLVKRQ